MEQPVANNELRDILIGVVVIGLIAGPVYLVPLVGFVFATGIPLPVMIFRMKLGRRAGAIICGSAALLIRIIYDGQGADLIMFIGLMLLGLAMCEFFDTGYPVETTIAASCGLVLAVGAAVSLFYTAMAGINLEETLRNHIQQNLELTLELYRQMDVSPETIEAVSRSADRIQYVLIGLIPAFSIMSLLFVAWVNVVIARPVFRRLRLRFPDYGPLNRWKAPEYLVWVAISGGMMLLVPVAVFKMVGLNILLVLLTVYMFQGIAITSFYFQRKNFPRWVRITLYTIIFLQQYAMIAVIGLGFFDLWLDFRKLKQEEQPE